MTLNPNQCRSSNKDSLTIIHRQPETSAGDFVLRKIELYYNNFHSIILVFHVYISIFHSDDCLLPKLERLFIECVFHAFPPILMFSNFGNFGNFVFYFHQNQRILVVYPSPFRGLGNTTKIRGR